MAFTWWRVVDGAAQPVSDTPEICRAIDAGDEAYFGSLEGAIIHGGVQACAFKRRTAQTYDAAEWLATGALVPAGMITTTTITAQPEA